MAKRTIREIQTVEHAGPVTTSGKYQVCAACFRTWKTEGKTRIPKCAPFFKGRR
jgi:hypothetical protein